MGKDKPAKRQSSKTVEKRDRERVLVVSAKGKKRFEWRKVES